MATSTAASKRGSLRMGHLQENVGANGHDKGDGKGEVSGGATVGGAVAYCIFNEDRAGSLRVFRPDFLGFLGDWHGMPHFPTSRVGFQGQDASARSGCGVGVVIRASVSTRAA